MAEENGRFGDILKFVKPDWPIVLTGVLFYGAIGACYPIIGALLAAINVVSIACSTSLKLFPVFVCFCQMKIEWDILKVMFSNQKIILITYTTSVNNIAVLCELMIFLFSTSIHMYHMYKQFSANNTFHYCLFLIRHTVKLIKIQSLNSHRKWALVFCCYHFWLDSSTLEG